MLLSYDILKIKKNVIVIRVNHWTMWLGLSTDNSD